MNVKNLLMVITAGVMTACTSKNDLFDNSKVENNTKQTYAQNFMKKYPNVDMNQNWDFSTKQSDYRLGSKNKARTRANEGGITTGSWYEVDNNTLAWMHEQLVEGEDNRRLGTSIKVRQEPCGTSTSWWMASITWCGRRSTRPVWEVLTRISRMKPRQVPSR